jgi:hypothetical protein
MVEWDLDGVQAELMKYQQDYDQDMTYQWLSSGSLRGLPARMLLPPFVAAALKWTKYTSDGTPTEHRDQPSTMP